MDSKSISDVCNTFLYSRGSSGERWDASEYLSDFIAYPDKESDFEKKISLAKYLFRIPILDVPLTFLTVDYLTNHKGYDVLLLKMQDSILGHSAFQIHPDNSLRIFSVQVLEDYRGKGFGERLVIDTLEVARNKKMDKIRVGGGNNEFTNKMYDRIVSKSDFYKVQDEGLNYVKLLY